MFSDSSSSLFKIFYSRKFSNSDFYRLCESKLKFEKSECGRLVRSLPQKLGQKLAE
jgi:hypothetical protein